MVSEQVVNDTVKRMLDSSIDEETIVSTLVDIGIDDARAKEIVLNVKNSSAQPAPVVEEKQTSNENPSSDRINSMQNELQTQAEKSELHETATHHMLNDHAQKLDSMNQKVDEVHKVVSSPQNVDASLKVRLGELEKKVADVNAQTTAMMDVMKKVLETNRSILTELKSK